MAIKCEAIVPEGKVKFPAVMEKGDGNRVLAITESLVIGSGGHVYDNSEYLDSYNYRPCSPGSKFVMKITAEDGREWPRIHTQSTKAIWVLLDEVCQFPVIDEHGEPMNLTFVVDWARGGKNLPAGTITTITFCDGEWTCEIQEPVERKEVELGEAIKRLVNDDEKLAAIINDGNGEFETTVMCKGNDLVMEGDVFISFGRLPDITFYELPAEPSLPIAPDAVSIMRSEIPEPAAEKEPDWLPTIIAEANIQRCGEYLQIDGHRLMPFQARILSEVAARFADEQEFPGESLPMKWTDEDIDVPPSQIDSDGHFELEKEWIRSEYEADRLMRAIRLYKRHLEAQK